MPGLVSTVKDETAGGIPNETAHPATHVDAGKGSVTVMVQGPAPGVGFTAKVALKVPFESIEHVEGEPAKSGNPPMVAVSVHRFVGVRGSWTQPLASSPNPPPVTVIAFPVVP